MPVDSNCERIISIHRILSVLGEIEVPLPLFDTPSILIDLSIKTFEVTAISVVKLLITCLVSKLLKHNERQGQ